MKTNNLLIICFVIVMNWSEYMSQKTSIKGLDTSLAKINEIGK